MSIITAPKITTSHLFYSVDNLFTLALEHKKEKTKMVMEIFIPVTTTAIFLSTKPILNKFLPSILTSTCFNEEDLPFEKEVENTEIGHLFEHILLEYLCLEKLANGFEEAIFSGRTNWNWQKDKQGIFHIVIDSGLEEAMFFPHAIEKSIILLRGILEELYPHSRNKQVQTYAIPSYLSAIEIY